jgi:hypothetical protein
MNSIFNRRPVGTLASEFYLAAILCTPGPVLAKDNITSDAGDPASSQSPAAHLAVDPPASFSQPTTQPRGKAWAGACKRLNKGDVAFNPPPGL